MVWVERAYPNYARKVSSKVTKNLPEKGYRGSKVKIGVLNVTYEQKHADTDCDSITIFKYVLNVIL